MFQEVLKGKKYQGGKQGEQEKEKQEEEEEVKTKEKEIEQEEETTQVTTLEDCLVRKHRT